MSDSLPSSAYAQALAELPGVDRARQKLEEPDTDASRVAVLEFMLEGLHLGKRLNDRGYIIPGLGDAGDRLFGRI